MLDLFPVVDGLHYVDELQILLQSRSFDNDEIVGLQTFLERVLLDHEIKR